jgi:segregation and condensation protein A
VPGKLEFHEEAAPAKPEVGIFDLLNAVNGILKRFADKEAATREIYEDKWTVSEKIEFVRNQIATRGSLKFSELFEKAANRAEVVCTFLALLELIRLKQLACVQPEPFAEIEIGQPVLSVEPSESSAPTAEISAEEKAPVATPEPSAEEADEDAEDEFDDEDEDDEDDEDDDGDDEDEAADEQPQK